MEICDFIYLDCKELKNRKKLLYLVKSVIKEENKPSKEKLQKICKSLSKKYRMKMRLFNNKTYMMASVEVDKESYFCFYCHSYYELMCKYILLVKYFKDNNLINKG